MLNIVCVKWGTLYGPEYVNILYDMVRRNIKEGTPGKFICFTDDPQGLHEDIETRELPGNLTAWWNKLYLFKDGLFPDDDRIIYFDLDTVITGSIDFLTEYKGNFAILRDFYRPNGLQSSVMAWAANKYRLIWRMYEAAGYPEIEGGDQAWIEFMDFPESIKPDIFQDIYPTLFTSYKVHCKAGIPKNSKIVVFHGHPRPHEVLDGWVPRIWKIDGGSSLEIEVEGNTTLENIKRNIEFSLDSGHKILSEQLPAHDRRAVIVGGGPSIKGLVGEIKRREEAGQDIVALNNSWEFLLENGIGVQKHIMLDAREENKRFVPDDDYGMEQYYATQCHPFVINAANSEKTTLWHALIPNIVDDFNDKNMFWVGSGTTVGIRSILLLYVLGYRHFHIYGYDSSYSDGEGHAYPQKLNDGEKIIEVSAEGRDFKAAPWMVTQTEEFLELMAFLTGEGCEFSIHGDGLLPHAVKTMLIPADVGTKHGDITEFDGISWPSSDRKGRNYFEATKGDIDIILGYTKGRKVVVQAGGNIGLWPKEFAKHFEAVYTFEPDPLNFRCLNLNCPEPNIIKLQAALGFERNLIDLARDENNCGAHFISGHGILPTLRIDDLALEACDLIQLDIEGFELNALKGALRTIDKFKPVIVVEDKGLSEQYGTKQGKIAEWLFILGYQLCANVHRDVVFYHQSGE